MNVYRDDKKSKFKRLKTCTDAQQQHVSTDPQEQQQPLYYLVSNETNQFLQVSGEIDQMIGSFSEPKIKSLQIPDLEVYRNVLEPNVLEYFKSKFDKVSQDYNLAMNGIFIQHKSLFKKKIAQPRNNMQISLKENLNNSTPHQ
ncbi:hypothetical protein CEXT_167581 [Caerostris extrusa]|uniref:Uncharacterized protein n=1 Tax=Caerostris extrusa TaxID=172846 RepID=A0AAV4Y3G9_CAEEX|nr:hypothetical protein CEXT_167581 [Caerostris extrusa]